MIRIATRAGVRHLRHIRRRPLRLVRPIGRRAFEVPESVAYDAKEKVLYVGNFGGEKLDLAAKDGLAYLSKVSLAGKVLTERLSSAPYGAGRIGKSPCSEARSLKRQRKKM